MRAEAEQHSYNILKNRIILNPNILINNILMTEKEWKELPCFNRAIVGFLIFNHFATPSCEHQASLILLLQLN